MTTTEIISLIAVIISFSGLLFMVIKSNTKFRIEIEKHKTYVDMQLEQYGREFRQHERLNEKQFENYHNDVVEYKREMKKDISEVKQKIDSNNKNTMDILLNISEKLGKQ